MKKIPLYLLVFLFSASAASAITITGPKPGPEITSSGDDVCVTYGFAGGDYLDFKTLCIKICLYESDIIFDDFIACQTITLTKNQLSLLSGGNWKTKVDSKLTFKDAHSPITRGDDYYVEWEIVECVPDAVSSLSALALAVGLIVTTRRRFGKS
ncbi:hypothetical protein QEH56_23180 [Pelagicoccus enzymogenes]|uniref:hypothetical protein n=1 Tax=Pelagicoccus enzymogenes TaxID=2773457 RepID=UPI00280EF69A|nr:hypothetical protein [Pelagicoccus enzymogenes]MDQ8201088.1 hypothetical protein [Pelagicoccus enzymogenes]